MENHLIHHYTSIGALASILQNRTIRFGRLDTLDDTEEAQSIGDFDFGSMLFASCWVEKAEEDIAQWAMYGHAMKGVRISLPRQPFSQVPMLSPTFLMNGLRCPGYVLSPDQIEDESMFLSRVNYVADIAAEYAARVQHLPPDGINVNGRIVQLATYKHLRWSFQQEVRFVLHATVGPSSWTDDADWARQYSELAEASIATKLRPTVRYIDRELSSAALASAKIVLGPLTDTSEQLIVESLVNSLAPGVPIRKSELTGLIRHR
ncbi:MULTISPECIES: hypothetical protein [Luteimonas]|uniref:hypothetical protein n=1 Tax=Luteimonas TaxID=83614 RepID=UPI00117BFF03|nr:MULTISPECIES: hypothetical protein [Luteimonas]